MPVDYRQLQAPATPSTDIPDPGYGLKARALANAFDEFHGERLEEFRGLQSNAGEIAGAAAGQTDSPNFKQGLARLTAYGQAYNHAAIGAYTFKSKAALDETTSRLRVQANGDPDLFAKTFLASRDGTLAGAPVEARAELARLYNDTFAAVHGQMVYDKANAQRENDRLVYNTGIDQQTSRAAAYYASGDFAKGADAEAELHKQIEGGHNAGLFTAEEAQQKKIAAMQQMTMQTWELRLDNALAKGTGGAEILDEFHTQHSDDLMRQANENGVTLDPSGHIVLSEAAYQQLNQQLTTRVRDHNTAMQLAKKEGKSEQDLKYEAGDIYWTNQLLIHGDMSGMGAAVLSKDLKPERATALNAQRLSQPSEPKSNEAARLAFEGRPEFIDMTREQILAAPLSSDDKLKAIDNQDKLREVWYRRPETARARADIKLELTPGKLSFPTDDQVKAPGRADAEFQKRVGALPPSQRTVQAVEEIKQQVIQDFKRQDLITNMIPDVQRRITNFQSKHPGDQGYIKDDAKRAERLLQLQNELKGYQAQAGVK